MRLPVIQSLWLEAPLSNLEKLGIQSFLAHGHEFHLYVYDEVAGVPAGAQVKDANEILPRENIFRDNQNTITGFSDWFRWAVLSAKGGFWVDTDVVCLAPFRFNDKMVVAHENVDDTFPGTAVLGGNDPLFSMLCDACRDFPAPQPWDNEDQAKRKILAQTQGAGVAGWGGVGGPQVLRSALQHFKRLAEVKPHAYFYPVPWQKWAKILDNTYANKALPYTEHTHAIHLWNNLLHRNGVDKNAIFPRNSLFARLQRQYGMDNRRWWHIVLPHLAPPKYIRTKPDA